jgi:hypothetical protein
MEVLAHRRCAEHGVADLLPRAGRSCGQGVSVADRGVWLAIFVIVGVLAGTAGGVLTWLAGARPSAAIVAGGGCFVTVVTFLVMLAGFLVE